MNQGLGSLPCPLKVVHVLYDKKNLLHVPSPLLFLLMKNIFYKRRQSRRWVEIHSKREQLQSLFVCQPSVLKNLVENSHFKRVGSRCSQSLWQKKRVQASTVENDLGNLDQKVKIRRS